MIILLFGSGIVANVLLGCSGLFYGACWCGNLVYLSAALRVIQLIRPNQTDKTKEATGETANNAFSSAFSSSKPNDSPEKVAKHGAKPLLSGPPNLAQALPPKAGLSTRMFEAAN
ncbi:hypothetical protein [Desulfosporosinus metallidurans]|uniref:hypothetical protein n=1 Tax=Desulfosporosinus metallidurans TaxID=1888891 RepID=UPI00147B6DC8|nr:hypothetical protein [Desulfosporosinus metallidurans]